MLSAIKKFCNFNLPSAFFQFYLSSIMFSNPGYLCFLFCFIIYNYIALQTFGQFSLRLFNPDDFLWPGPFSDNTKKENYNRMPFAIIISELPRNNIWFRAGGTKFFYNLSWISTELTKIFQIISGRVITVPFKIIFPSFEVFDYHTELSGFDKHAR